MATTIAELLISVRAQVDKFKGDINKIGKLLSDLGKKIKITVPGAEVASGQLRELGQSLGGLSAFFGKAGGSAGILGSKLSGLGGTIGALTSPIGVTVVAVGALATGMIALGKKSLAMAAQVETAMADVSTLVSATSVDMEMMTQSIVSMTTDVGRSATDLAGGLYQAISAGVEISDSLDFINVTAKAASAGLTSTNVSVDALTSILNSYGKQVSETRVISDQLFKTVERGKCVTGDTRVLLSDGAYKRIDELQVGGEIISFDGRTFVPMQAQWIDQGIKPIVKLRTRLGREISTTWNHPYLAYQSEIDHRTTRQPQWKKVSELKIGDRIAVPTALPFFGDIHVTKAEASLLGLWLAEGSGNASSPRIASTNYGSEIVQWASHWDCSAKNVTSNPDKCPVWEITAGKRGGHNSNPVKELLKEYGLDGCKCEDKHIPDVVFTWDRESMTTFLHWLFNGDGWLCDNRPFGNSGFQLGFASKSERLVRDVSHLLLRFGIIGKIIQRDSHWRWEAKRYDEIRRFVEFIGVDRPATSEVLNHTPDRVKRQYGVVEYDVIIAIESDKKQHVYDLTVQELHNFVANDIIAHNTTFAELAGSIGRVTPLAATLDVVTEELFASVSTLTAGGLSTGESITALSGVMDAVISPSEQAKDVAEELGLSFNAASMRAKGFAGFIEEVMTATAGSEEQLSKLLGRKEALIAMLTLGGKGAQKFSEDILAIRDSTGAVDIAFEKQQATFAATMNMFRLHVDKLTTSIGQKLLPIATSTMLGINKAMNAYQLVALMLFVNHQRS
jgi:hypothetical protein